jgi:dTDP-4-amino-4,6-dideoxygalactose transaminase
MSTRTYYVGRPNVVDRESFIKRVHDMLDRKWLTNDGPLVREFEERIQNYVGAKHAIAVNNATIGLELAIRALNLTGEVIVPSYTFIASAHSLRLQGITPVFADIDPVTHNLDTRSAEALITPRTTAIMGVHLWGRACNTDSVQALARKHSLRVIYDAAHAFGCSRQGRMIGTFGDCEVFSFHATKFLNSFEGGAITTNSDELAAQLRLIRNFGFIGFDKVVRLGTNAKMPEICAAMGLTSLESIGSLIATNRNHYALYQQELASLPSLSLINYDHAEKNNFQYIVIEIDKARCPVSRDALISVLHSHNILARKYFWPGCHKMEPYRTEQPSAAQHLPCTELVADRVIVLPTGTDLQPADILFITSIIKAACASA